MSQFSSWRPVLRAGVGLAAAAVVVATVSCANSGTSKSAEQKQLSGQDLYAINCGRCHPERYATERNAAHWQTLMLHMQVRANIPPDQAKTILKYLQEDSRK